MLGLSAATANYACEWCKIHKDGKWKNITLTLILSPLPGPYRKLKRCPKNQRITMGEPLLNIDLDHIIVDELHLLLRITDILTSNLITEAIEWDVEENIENKNQQQTHLNML